MICYGKMHKPSPLFLLKSLSSWTRNGKRAADKKCSRSPCICSPTPQPRGRSKAGGGDSLTPTLLCYMAVHHRWTGTSPEVANIHTQRKLLRFNRLHCLIFRGPRCFTKLGVYHSKGTCKNQGLFLLHLFLLREPFAWDKNPLVCHHLKPESSLCGIKISNCRNECPIMPQARGRSVWSSVLGNYLQHLQTCRISASPKHI